MKILSYEQFKEVNPIELTAEAKKLADANLVGNAVESIYTELYRAYVLAVSLPLEKQNDSTN